ncbi:MAG: hypothetical protein IRZ16_18285 [Myxococcaceae bacterium]|nr:hypothetical protein [Myxococcaceae bacterium]
MKTTALLSPVGVVAIALAASACGKEPAPPPDAGVDTSCGIDCEAQNRYGLILHRCFEYTDTSSAQTLPALGVLVSEVTHLESGPPVIKVEYSQAGARKMTDSFMIVDGTLKLARREWVSGGSVTYKDAEGTIVGVDLWQLDTAAGQNFSTEASADFISPNGTRQTEETTFSVVTAAPTTTEKTVPAGTFDNAIKVLVNEQPPHGMDPRRIFVEGTGFTLISTALSATPGSGKEYRLQGIRDIGTPDAGAQACGLAP